MGNEGLRDVGWELERAARRRRAHKHAWDKSDGMFHLSDRMFERFTNLSDMSNSSKERNTMILIIVAILFFMYKDKIMKSGVVKSLKKMLK